MNLGIILIELILALLLTLIMNYLNNDKTNNLDQIILPNIYIILISAILPWFKNYTLIVIIFYLIFDILYLNLTTKKQLLINLTVYYKNIFLTLISSIIVYHFFLLKVQYAYLDMEIFKNFIWVLIILYFLKKVDLSSLKRIDNAQNFEENFQEYVIVWYAKFKNKYQYLIKSKNSDIENILYSFLIYENYLHGNLYRTIKKMQTKIFKTNTYGIMQVNSDHFITDEESIVIEKEKLEAKLKRVKNTKDDNFLKKLIKEKYPVTSDVEEVLKILKIIENFQKID